MGGRCFGPIVCASSGLRCLWDFLGVWELIHAVASPTVQRLGEVATAPAAGFSVSKGGEVVAMFVIALCVPPFFENRDPHGR